MTAEIDTDGLLDVAASGDEAARGELLERHRARLRRMLAVRMDERLAARFDPSDVVQDALAEAASRLPKYLDDRPLAFYPWLRQLALQKLIDLHRHHHALRRDVNRERASPLSDRSAATLARRLACPLSGPGRTAARRETVRLVRRSLDRLKPEDRELLVMYHLEHLSVPEIAQVLGLSEAAVRSRRRRALERLAEFSRSWLGDEE